MTSKIMKGLGYLALLGAGALGGALGYQNRTALSNTFSDAKTTEEAQATYGTDADKKLITYQRVRENDGTETSIYSTEIKGTKVKFFDQGADGTIERIVLEGTFGETTLTNDSITNVHEGKTTAYKTEDQSLEAKSARNEAQAVSEWGQTMIKAVEETLAKQEIARIIPVEVPRTYRTEESEE